MTESIATLSPPTDRWRPIRAGLVNLWRYWDETFTFHRGRLLLRGANGSGKSMALELLLPFLLDADASPARLTSAVKSRGGLFDRVMTGTDESTRTGFAWVEFARRDQTFTAGARIRASQATRRAEADFFTTSLAVGRELRLLDGTRTPLSKKALEEAIGETGRVHSTAEEHRKAIREVLFPDFGADRYASVIGALLALRKEKLSQNLDLDKLSEVLSDALPPIDDHDVAVVAEGFERLDRRRDELASLERELGEVRQLATRQRDYARSIVVAVAGEVRSAEYRRDEITRGEREALEELSSVQGEATAVAAEHQKLEEREEVIGVEIEALKDSPAYPDGAALSDLRNQAVRFREMARRAETSAGERTEALLKAREELDESAAACEAASVNLERARRDLRQAVEPAGAPAVVDEAERVEDADEAERLVDAWLGAQRGRVEAVRASVEAYERALAERQFREEQVATDEEAVRERANAAVAATAQVEAVLAEYRRAVAEWVAGCASLGPDRLLAVLPQPAEPQAMVAAIAEIAAAIRAEDAVARHKLAAEREAVTDEREALEHERARWEAAFLPDPEAACWRADRTGRPGAPLWRLVDLAGDLGTNDDAAVVVDGLEAALTGAGLLDAWVQPDGSVELTAMGADVVLTARPLAGPTLSSVLAPAPPTGAEPLPVATDVVASVVSSIALVDTAGRGDDVPEVAVARDGTYRLGSAVGCGPSRPARLLGAVARERHRLARLSELDVELAEVDARLGAILRGEADLDRRRTAVEAELATLPSPAPVDEAEQRAAESAACVREAEARLDASRAALRSAEDGVRGGLRALTALGARNGLPTDRRGLAAAEAALARLGEAVVVWARRRREAFALEREHRRVRERASKAEQDAARADQEHADAEREATAIEGRVEALESSVGTEYRDMLVRLGALDEERTAARRRLRELGRRGLALSHRVGELQSRVETAAAARLEAEAAREGAQRRLVAAADELGPDAAISPSDGLDTASAVLAFARAVASEYQRVDAQPETVERLSERVREAVHQAQTALGARVDLDRELGEAGWWVLRTAVGGVRRRARELSEALATELAQGREELAADEERLFEQTLAGSVRRSLAARIRQANELVDHINVQLAAVRTEAGGVQVRLRWEVDAEQPDAVKAARSLLLRDPADLSDRERESLQAFVRARVDQARAELEANAPWEARLRETLDYRVWHRFALQIGHRDWDGDFRTATPRRLQKLSTGERSIALHLPMIASVAAHYAVGSEASEDGTRPPAPGSYCSMSCSPAWTTRTGLSCSERSLHGISTRSSPAITSGASTRPWTASPSTTCIPRQGKSR